MEELARDRLLVEDAAVLASVLLERRRWKRLRAWNEAMDDRRCIELRRDELGGPSSDSLSRDGISG